MAADYDTAVYVEQGGAKLIVASGGELEIQSGGTLDLQSGSSLTCSDTLSFGTMSSTVPGSGILLDSTDTVILQVHGDDNNTALGSATTARCIDGRLMNYNSPAAETWGIQGKCKVSTLAMTANVKAGVVGSFESTGTCSLATGLGNTFIAGVMGRLGLASGMTLAAGTYACGVLSFYNTLAANDPTGEYTCAFMATASDIAGVGDWDYGLYVEDTATGINIDDCTTAINIAGTLATSGLNFSNATMPVASDNVSLINIGTYDAGLSSGTATDNTFAVMNNRTSTADDAYWFMNEYMKISMTTADQTNKSFVNLGIRQAIAKPVAATYGIQSHLTFSGTGDVASEIIALSAQLAGTAATGTGYHWGVKSDLRATNTPSGAGHTSACFFGVGTVSCSSGLYIEPLGSTTMYSGAYFHAAGSMTNVIEVGGASNTTNFLKFDAAAGCLASKAADVAGDNTAYSLKVDIGGSTYYLALWSNWT